METLINNIAQYGFPGGMAILFWRYITKVQNEQVSTLQNMSNQLEDIQNKVTE